MSLSVDQLADLRADLGDEIVPYAFTDTELQRLYTRRGSNYDATIVLAIDQLLANSVKFYNYAAGYTRQEQAGIVDNLLKLRAIKLKVNNGAILVGVTIVPPGNKDEPSA